MVTLSLAARLRRRTLLGIVAGSICATTTQAAEPGISAGEIVVGQNITLQGGKNRYGVAALDGIKLHFEAVNAAGGIHGRKVVLRTLDDDNKSPAAEANARKLVGEGAFILFASQEGGPSTAVATAAEELRVPVLRSDGRLAEPAPAAFADGVSCACRAPR